MKVIVKFKSIINLVWGTPVNGREAFAFVRGFPATFFLTERRAIVVGEFLEKLGWFKQKQMHRIIFEAGLHKMKDFGINILPNKRIFTGFINFHPHNQIGEEATIQFLKMRPEIGKVIEDHLSNLDIKNPVEDSGIIMVDATAIPPQRWLNKRFGKKDGLPKISY